MISDSPRPTARLSSFTVGDWLVEPKSCLISRGDTVRKVRPQLIDLLVCLARRAGEVVLRDDILAEVWSGQYIADSGVSRCISELRLVLQDDAHEPTFIEVFRKRGYRLIAPVIWLDPPAPAGIGQGQQGGEPVEPPADRPAAVEAVQPEASRVATAGAQVGAGRFRPRRSHMLMGTALLVVVVASVTVMMPHSPASVLTDQDVVLLAFENRTGDKVFDETIPLAMSLQMAQTPYLGLVSPGRIQEVLHMMQRPPETTLTRAIGLEVCERLGGRALIVTSIAPLGRQYAIGMEAVRCEPSRRVLARQQVMADGKEQVLAGLERAAAEIRRAVGEPAASRDRYSVPIVQATTASVGALRALSRGDLARDRGETRLALDLYREAVSFDPGFALAQLRRGTLAASAGNEAECQEAFEKAYALRERVTLPERLEIEASYHYFVTGEEGRVIEALELLKRTYPRRAQFRRNLADVHMWAGRHDAALSEALEAQRLEPNSITSLSVVGRAYLYSNRVAEARTTAEKAIALGGTSPGLHLILFQCALATADQKLLARVRAWAAEHPDLAVPLIVEAEAEESLNRGRLQEALGFLQQYEATAIGRGAPRLAAVVRLRMARYQALAGLRARALERLDAEMRRGLAPEIRIDAVKVAISAGAFDLAARLLDEIERGGLGVAAQPDATFIRAYRAAIDASRGRIDEALSRLAPLEPLDLGNAFGFIPLFERAQTYYLAGNWAMARAAYEKILAHPTLDSGRKLLPLAQLGLARTLARAGDAPASRRTYEQFFERWKSADPDLPLLAQARQEYEELAR